MLVKVSKLLGHRAVSSRGKRSLSKGLVGLWEMGEILIFGKING